MQQKNKVIYTYLHNIMQKTNQNKLINIEESKICSKLFLSSIFNPWLKTLWRFWSYSTLIVLTLKYSTITGSSKCRYSFPRKDAKIRRRRNVKRKEAINLETIPRGPSFDDNGDNDERYTHETWHPPWEDYKLQVGPKICAPFLPIRITPSNYIFSKKITNL